MLKSISEPPTRKPWASAASPVTTSPAGTSSCGYRSPGKPDSAAALLPDEAALALNYNGLAHSVMMVSPVDLEDFALGFSLSNGLLESAEELYGLQVSGAAERWQADMEVSSRAFWRLKAQRRALAGTSGCGLCGVEALSQALPDLPRLPAHPVPPASALDGLRDRIAQRQKLGQLSGAVHAALFVDDSGAIRLCREDIGRHNAFDKLIGALARGGFRPEDGFAVLTSRCSLELVQKAVRARIPSLVCLSAPTSTSVSWARAQGLTLIHLPRQAPARLYSS